jgi:Ca2+-binding RTX toxin-like protein
MAMTCSTIGGAGNDRAVYSFLGASAGVSFSGSGLVSGQLADEAGNLESATDVEAIEVDGSDWNDYLIGSGGGDVLYGNFGNDSLIGFGGEDVLEGGSDDDFIVGGEGSDRIDGGDGIDLAHYDGTRSDYLVTDNGDGTISIADQRSGASDGTDTVSGVETFRFAGQDYTLAQLFSTGNTAPTGSATATLLDGTEDQTYIVSAADLLQGFSDADADLLTVDGLSADHATVTDNGDGSFSLDLEADYNGTLILSYNVIDGQGGSLGAQQSIVIAAVNDVPTAVGTVGAQSATEDAAFSFTLPAGVFSDNDGETLALTATRADGSALPTWLAFDSGTGTFSGTPANADVGALDLRVTAADGANASATQSFSLTVSNINDAPTGSASAVLTAGTEDTPYTVSAADLLAGFTDEDAGDTLEVQGLTSGTGTVTDNGDGSWTITPTANANGAFTLSYEVTDGNAAPLAATQTFTLAAVNDAPTAGDDSATTSRYTTIAIPVLGNDTDVESDPLTISAVTQPTTGTGSVAISGGVINYTAPGGNWSGTTSFTYTVSDGQGGSATATVSVTVTPTVVGTEGADTLSGSNADDTINGLGGNDTIDARSGNDTVDAGSGDDQITGGIGADVLRGEAGIDVFNVSGGDLSEDTINGGADIDTVRLTGNVSLSGGLTLTEVEQLNLNGFTLSTAGSLNLSAYTLTGAGTVQGSAAANSITGTAQGDTIIGLGGADALTGGDGNDSFNVGGSDLTGDSVNGGDGSDTLIFTSNVTLAGTFSTVSIETLNMGGRSLTVNTAAAVDLSSFQSVLNAGTIQGSSAVNTITGTQGNDVLSGLAGNDVLGGAGGADWLYGGAGNDNLTGGTGSDTFVFNTALGSTNVDTLTDFDATTDKLYLDRSVFDSVYRRGTAGLDLTELRINGNSNLALDANDYIIYNNNTGGLYYDADGAGAKSVAVLIGNIGAGKLGSLDITDFVVGTPPGP